MESQFDERQLEIAENFHMPWGKFRGIKLKDVPNNYLNWVAENTKEFLAAKADLVRRWRETYNITVD